MQSGRAVPAGARSIPRAHPPPPGRARFPARKLALRLEVEAKDVLFQRERDLSLGLADAREERLARVAPGGEHAGELARRDDVESGAQPREGGQHREVRVSLDRVADEGIAPA